MAPPICILGIDIAGAGGGAGGGGGGGWGVVVVRALCRLPLARPSFFAARLVGMLL